MSERTPLFDIIHNMILEHGTISLSAYMALCLGHPRYGYYMTHEPFGAHGDFTTAPEVSQMFGEMVALWVMTTWQQMGEPKNLQLVELGPGRGTLMKDIWRAISVLPDLRNNVKIHLVEFSPRLQKIQQETLASVPVTWHTQFESIPENPTLILANEFFDALPVEQAMHHQGQWYQRIVTAEEEDLILSLGSPLAGIHVEEPKDRDIFEYAPVVAQIMEQFCKFIQENTGGMLIIDYGDNVQLSQRIGDTVQALKDHKPIDILEAPGESDITAHVSFDALADIATEQLCRVAPLRTQRQFLLDQGIRVRSDLLLATADEKQSADIRSALARLTDHAEMGDLFKVLEVYSTQ